MLANVAAAFTSPDSNLSIAALIPAIAKTASTFGFIWHLSPAVRAPRPLDTPREG
jgi:hypothetical protein